MLSRQVICLDVLVEGGTEVKSPSHIARHPITQFQRSKTHLLPFNWVVVWARLAYKAVLLIASNSVDSEHVRADGTAGAWTVSASHTYRRAYIPDGSQTRCCPARVSLKHRSKRSASARAALESSSLRRQWHRKRTRSFSPSFRFFREEEAGNVLWRSFEMCRQKRSSLNSDVERSGRPGPDGAGPTTAHRST